MRKHYAGTPVTATEPVFGYMSDALGRKMRNPRFQLAIMNDAEPTPDDIAAFQKPQTEITSYAAVWPSCISRSRLD